jgi:8-hydroxy-5-deazaflavin:NADPH oxidoreductase
MRIDRVAIVGGTGPQGRGLAMRLAAAGCAVVIGSRDRTRAEETAAAIRTATGGGAVTGAANVDAVSSGVDVTIVAIPVDGLRATLLGLHAPLAGRIVVDVVVPLAKHGGLIEFAPPPEAPSAGEYVQHLLSESRVVGAFKNIPASHLADVSTPLEGDVLVCGDDAEARGVVAGLVGRIGGLRAVDAGPMRLARPIEAITALLVNLNRRHRAHTSIRILGLGGR